MFLGSPKLSWEIIKNSKKSVQYMLKNVAQFPLKQGSLFRVELEKMQLLKVNSQLSHGIPTEKLPQIITKVCKFTKNTAKLLYF